jgi:hypothetical protein
MILLVVHGVVVVVQGVVVVVVVQGVVVVVVVQGVVVVVHGVAIN